jgi:chromosome segregation ATPase
MQQNEIVIEGFEDKIKKLENSLKQKGSLLRSAEGSLAEAHSQNEKLSKELNEARTLLEKNSDRFDRKSKALDVKIEAEIEKNHYRNPRLCRVSASLSSAFCRALGKEGFAESHTR